MGELFCNDFIISQGAGSTEEYIFANRGTKWITFNGYEFYENFVEERILVPLSSGIKVSNETECRCYKVIDKERVEAVACTHPHRGAGGIYLAQEVIENPDLGNGVWATPGRDLARRLRMNQLAARI